MNKQEYRLYLAILKARGDQARKARLATSCVAKHSRHTDIAARKVSGRY